MVFFAGAFFAAGFFPLAGSVVSGAGSVGLLTTLALRELDAVPRISRAQALDVLSSMGNVAGYRAVIEAAHA